MRQLRITSLCAAILLAGLQVDAQAPASQKTKEGLTNVKATSKAGALTSIKGVHDMTLQKVGSRNGDSIYRIQQIKIFTDKYFMYAHELPDDTLAEYGVGTYRLQNGKVIEYPFYTSAGPQKDSFALQITKIPDGYSQVINFPPNDEGTSFVLTENYRTVSRNVNSPLDGAWKMTKQVYYPKEGPPETDNAPIQFKFFQSGHYMWVRTMMDSATQKRQSYYGYGSFDMTSPNEAKEKALRSALHNRQAGNSYDLQITFKGKNSYEQTIVWPSGSKTVETYTRLQ